MLLAFTAPALQELLNTVLCPPFPADGGNTLLHYLLGGAGLGTLGRLLWASAGGVASAEVGGSKQTLPPAA